LIKRSLIRNWVWGIRVPEKTLSGLPCGEDPIALQKLELGVTWKTLTGNKRHGAGTQTPPLCAV
jgi:hypothetical protein